MIQTKPTFYLWQLIAIGPSSNASLTTGLLHIFEELVADY